MCGQGASTELSSVKKDEVAIHKGIKEVKTLDPVLDPGHPVDCIIELNKRIKIVIHIYPVIELEALMTLIKDLLLLPRALITLLKPLWALQTALMSLPKAFMTLGTHGY